MVEAERLGKDRAKANLMSINRLIISRCGPGKVSRDNNIN
jgi:hypothetical protein